MLFSTVPGSNTKAYAARNTNVSWKQAEICWMVAASGDRGINGYRITLSLNRGVPLYISIVTLEEFLLGNVGADDSAVYVVNMGSGLSLSASQRWLDSKGIFLNYCSHLTMDRILLQPAVCSIHRAGCKFHTIILLVLSPEPLLLNSNLSLQCKNHKK